MKPAHVFAAVALSLASVCAQETPKVQASITQEDENYSRYTYTVSGVTKGVRLHLAIEPAYGRTLGGWLKKAKPSDKCQDPCWEGTPEADKPALILDAPDSEAHVESIRWTLESGESGATKRLGRGVSLWSDPSSFARAKRTYDHVGPYMPVILQACQEKELSYEYRHGVTSYGAFTYCLTRIFRELKRGRGRLTFEELIARVAERLKELHYAQHPALVGPQVKRTVPIPSLLGEAPKRG